MSTTLDMIDEFIETLKPSEGSKKTFKYLSEANVIQLCQKAKEILQHEANVQPVQSPVTIVVCLCLIFFFVPPLNIIYLLLIPYPFRRGTSTDSTMILWNCFYWADHRQILIIYSSEIMSTEVRTTLGWMVRWIGGWMDG